MDASGGVPAIGSAGTRRTRGARGAVFSTAVAPVADALPSEAMTWHFQLCIFLTNFAGIREGSSSVPGAATTAAAHLQRGPKVPDAVRVIVDADPVDMLYALTGSSDSLPPRGQALSVPGRFRRENGPRPVGRVPFWD